MSVFTGEGLLTINMFIGEPVVFGVLVLKVRVPLPALLLSEILQVLGAVLGVAQLELVARPHARTASVGRTATGRETHGWFCHCFINQVSIKSSEEQFVSQSCQ